MKIGTFTIKQIQESSQLKAEIALKLNKSIHTVERLLRDNEDNGDLTKLAVINLLTQHFEAPIDELIDESF